MLSASLNKTFPSFLPTHGTMSQWIEPSWWGHRVISCSSQCLTTGITKAVVCTILSVRINRTWKKILSYAIQGVLYHNYDWHHITNCVIKVFVHGVMILHGQCSTTGVTKAEGCGMYYPVLHIKEPLLPIRKSSPCGGSRFPLIIWVVLYHMSDAI